ncbi:selenocysteine-specific translation elongation factor [Campylobacter gastrosuis]|uniref:Selenocysteine-specific translation elongation factor n=1 Tax=Campylobacter gastrosuis TaxID=2974576 RepID=A0ABT7HP52_9BACT|nr:selenocysteine-specific translation elongation factor [Campylobacter gastrosuis]MDL0088696.1 selenocysteine-specific translation elongation factor [Campylobacter gastrosuis]
MSSLIIGTAGHIDHGKTSLIRAINGFEGDTLAQEKERGITIDLSFSNLKNGDENISFIDVPGHENLVKTMISGAFGFDACLLVVAANDGVMPQTIEHVKILNLLNVKSVILAISKADLVESWRLDEVLTQAKQLLKIENLELLNHFFVSINDKLSINELKNYLFTLKPKKRDESGIFRYYIDRAFSIKGIGSVVTGSVLSGSVRSGEKLFNYDLSKEVLVRSVQTHENDVKTAGVSTRVALNLSGVEFSELKKGQLLSKKGFFRGNFEADVILFANVNHNESVTFCVGAKQGVAKVLILSDEKHKFATLKFNKEMFLCFNEPFVLLKDGRVVGGGRVLNAITEPLKKQSKIALLNALNELNFKRAFEILKQSHKNGFGLISAFQRFNLTHEDALKIAKTLSNCFVDEAALNVYDDEAILRVKEFIKFILSKNEFALFSATSISLKLTWVTQNLAQKALNELENERFICKNDGVYMKNGVDFSKIKLRLEDEILKILQNSSLTPDAPYNIYDELDIDRISGDNALKKLTAQGVVKRLAHNLFVTQKSLEMAVGLLKEIIKKDGFVNVQNAKNELNLSRKFALAYLEYLDTLPEISKVGQDRVFKEV